MQANAFFRRQTGLGALDWLDPWTAQPGGSAIRGNCNSQDSDCNYQMTKDEFAIYNSCGEGVQDQRWIGASGMGPRFDCLFERKWLAENAQRIADQNATVIQQQQAVIAAQLEKDRAQQAAYLQSQMDAANAAAQQAIKQAQQAQAAAQAAAAQAQSQQTAASAAAAAALAEAARKAREAAEEAIRNAQNQGGSYEVGSGENIPGSVVVNSDGSSTAIPAQSSGIPWLLILGIGSAVVFGG
jgi:hypothetical protein